MSAEPTYSCVTGTDHTTTEEDSPYDTMPECVQGRANFIAVEWGFDCDHPGEYDCYSWVTNITECTGTSFDYTFNYDYHDCY